MPALVLAVLTLSVLGLLALLGWITSVYYFFFEKCRESILQSKAKVAAAAATSATATIANGGALSTFESILAGVIAGTATTVSTNPIWIVNTRQTVRVGVADPSAAAKAAATKRLGFLQTMQKIVREEGPLALWKGLGPALVLVINPVLQYTAFEQLKNWVVKTRLARANGGKVSLSDWDFFWLGALSKLFATGLTYPQIVIKSRQHAGSSKGASTNIWTAMTEIVQKEGIAGLYRGITSKLLQSVLTAAILFLAKERVFNITKAVSSKHSFDPSERRILMSPFFDRLPSNTAHRPSRRRYPRQELDARVRFVPLLHPLPSHPRPRPYILRRNKRMRNLVKDDADGCCVSAVRFFPLQ